MSKQQFESIQQIHGRIDIHTHIMPRTWPNWNERFGYPGWLTIEHDEEINDSSNFSEDLESRPMKLKVARIMNSDGTLFRKVEENCWCPKSRIKEMDEKGVDVQVMCTIPGTGFNYHVPVNDALVVARFLNDHLRDVISEYPTRFIGLGTVPMQDTKTAIEELRRCMNELGLVGVQIGSHINGKNLESPDLEPFWAEAEALSAAIFIHPWYMGTEERLSKHWFQWTLAMPHETAVAASSLIFGGVLEKHPKLRVCLSHGGGSFPFLIGRLGHAFDCRPDLCQTCNKVRPENYLNRLYYDALVHDGEILQLLVKKTGTNRVIMGSDYPFPLGEIEKPGGLIEEIYSNDPQTKKNLLYENALEFLGISDDRQQK